MEVVSLIKADKMINIPGLVIGNHSGLIDAQFGCRSGTITHSSSVYHEISHAIEFFKTDPKRLSYGTYYFKLPEQYVYDQLVLEPNSTEPTERELRTLAIQAHLMIANPLSGLNDSTLRSFALSNANMLVSFMPDWFNILHLHVENHETLNADEKKSARINWCYEKFFTYFNSYDIHSIWPQALKRVIHSLNDINIL